MYCSVLLVVFQHVTPIIRQRLSIARVLLDKPKVIIFDESTSSLDTQIEDRLLKALDEYIENKTMITIDHHQTTIDRANRVIKLDVNRNEKEENVVYG